MKRSIRIWAVGLVAIGIISIAAVTAIGSSPGSGTRNNVLSDAIAVEQGVGPQAPHREVVSGGAVNTALDFTGALERRADASRSRGDDHRSGSNRSMQGCQNVFAGGRGGDNVRVNQDCSLRRQAEEVVAVDPTNPDHLIAGQNDSRVGFNHCGYDWSFDAGKTWGDQVPPFYQFVMADGHTADACSDPTAAFDSKGNVYIGGILFDINSAASAFVVAKSNANIGGTFFHSPAAVPFQTYRDTPLGVIASDNDPNVFHDKEFLVADATASSPKADNVYATWTRFSATDSPIYFSQSTDGGATWSPGVEISGSSATLCTAFSGEADPKACDQDQGSHPVVGADGTVYVAFANGNTSTAGLNQHLLVKCAASKDCSQQSNWVSPTKIGDDYGTQPFGPDGTSGCPGGRQCLPPNGYRMDDFVEGSLAVDNGGTLYAAWADFRNSTAGCVFPTPAAGSCDNDVFYAYSTDGGATWSSTTNVTPAAKIGKSAQWMPWSAVSPDGKRYYVAYYDRSYGSCETDGCNDITMATITKAATGSPKIKYTRITTSSMPNLVPANNPVQAGFLGDYMWVSADTKGRPHIAWADTRGLNGAVEEDIYAASPSTNGND